MKIFMIVKWLMFYWSWVENLCSCINWYEWTDCKWSWWNLCQVILSLCWKWWVIKLFLLDTRLDLFSKLKNKWHSENFVEIWWFIERRELMKKKLILRS